MTFFHYEHEAEDLHTERLRLVAMTPDLLVAEIDRDAELGALLEARIPMTWPPVDFEPFVVTMIQQQALEFPEKRGWHRYFVWNDAPNGATLVGCCGGFPKENGIVEIGYSTIPEFQRQGFATEAVQALVDYLLRQDGVTAIHAQALCETEASFKVMERAGLTKAGEGEDPGTLRYIRER